MSDPLDRPVWSALTTRQAHFGPAGDLARRYPVDIGPLAGMVDDSPEALAALLDEGSTPILHTYAANTGAVALYRKLGCEVRTEMVHAVWKRG